MNEARLRGNLGQRLSTKMVTVLLFLAVSIPSGFTQSFMNGGASLGGNSPETCLDGQIYCFLRKKCVGLNGVPTPESCANGSGTDDSGDWGDHGGWNGDWDMGGGDDGQCHGDSCTVCDEGQVFCMMHRRCVSIGQDVAISCSNDYHGDDHGDDGGLDGDWGMGGDEGHCHGDSCTVCDQGQVFCVMRQRCVDLAAHLSQENACSDDNDSDNGGNDGGWDGDWGMGGDEGHCHGDSCTVCEQEQVFCVMRQRCVDLAAHLSQENACSDDNDSDNGGNDGGWDGDWGMGGDEGHCHGDACTVCEQGQVFCVMRQRCVDLAAHLSQENACSDDNGSDNGGNDGGWDGDWGMGGDEGHCHGDSCTVCEQGQVFCVMRQRCVDLAAHLSQENACSDDNGSDYGGNDGGWDGNWGMGSDEGHCHGDSCTVCVQGQVFCVMRQRCVDLAAHLSQENACSDDNDSDNGGNDGGWDGDWGMGGDEGHCHGDSCTVCEQGQVFCVMRQRCVDLAAHLSQENACSDDNGSDYGGNDGGWDGNWGMGSDEGHCHGDSCTVCVQGQVFCVMRQRCVDLAAHLSQENACSDDNDSDNGGNDGGWDGDWGMGGDEGHCHGDACTVCEQGQVFCVMRQRCVDLAAHLSQENACSDDNDSDNGGNYGGWDGNWEMGGDEGHCHGDSCTVCEQGQVFCAMRKTCVPLPINVCEQPPTPTPEPDGMCPAPNSTVFVGLCNIGLCAADGSCDEGKICCYSDECNAQVCVVPEEPSRGTCPADDASMSYDMMCGGAACLNDTDCAMEGLICCELQNLCGSKRCVLSVEDSAPEPDGMCPAPDSQVFEGLCSMPPCGPDVCDGGKICCYSNECGVEVCVMPEEPQRGTCPADDASMSYDMMCGGAACLNDTDCAMEGLICCELQNLCGSKRCVLSVEDSAPEPDGMCPAPDSQVFEGLCSMGPCGPDVCNGGKICCYSNECGVEVCVMPEEPQRGTCPADDTSMSTFDLCGGAACLNDTDCAMEGKICCELQNLCAGKRCVLSVEDSVPEPDGMCPAPDSQVFEGLCSMPPCGPDVCDGGKICCYSNECGVEVCVMPEEPQRGTCPPFEASMVGVCGTQSFCQNDTDCAVDGKICCESPCGGKICMLSLEDSDDGGDGSHSGWEPDSGGDNEPVCSEDRGCHQCGLGQIFCIMRGRCVDVAVLEPCPCPEGQVWDEKERTCKLPPEEPDPTVFFLSMKPLWQYDYLRTSANTPSVTVDSVVSRLDNLAGHIRSLLENQLILQPQLTGTGAILEWVEVYPTLGGEGGKAIEVWSKISVDYEAISQEDLEQLMESVILTSPGGNQIDYEYQLHKVSEDPIYTFAITTPLVRDQRRDIVIRELIPDSLRDKLPADLRDIFPTQASLSCEMEHKVFFIDPATNDKVRSITVEGSSIIVTVTQTDEDIKRVECSVVFPELLDIGVNSTYQLMLTLIPANIPDLARVSNITLLEPGMMIPEDGECQRFPDQLFDITVGGDSFVNKHHDWAQRMMDTDELWLGPNVAMDIKFLLAEYVAERALSLSRARYAEIKITADTRYDNNRLVAILKDVSGTSPKELKTDGEETRILETREELMICVAANYYGFFEIEIIPSMPNINPMVFYVEVTPTNDAPVAVDNIDKVIKTQEAFVYPPVDPDASVDVPQVPASDLVRIFYSDEMDRNDNLFMGLLGYKESSADGSVAGTWEYADSDGAAWQPIPLYEPPELSESEVEMSMTLLSPTALVRFSLSSDDESKSYRLSEAPRIVFLAVDDPSLDPSTTVVLHQCTTGSRKLCGPGGTTNFSEAIIDFALLRRGCDGVIDSGSLNLDSLCDCDIDVCLDCKGEQGGDAQTDACGVCNAPEDMATTAAECLPEEESPCEAGLVLDMCNVCVAEGSDLSGENECGIPCSDDLPCLDCNDEPHGVAELNLCGVCTSPGDTTGCNVKIGKVYPPFQFVHSMSWISIYVSDILMATPVDDIVCVLEPMGDSTVIPQVISIANGSSLPAASGIDPSLISDNTLHLELEVDPDSVQDSAGQFDIICSFDTTTVALSESFDNVLLYTRFGFPTITSISPVEAFISDIGEVQLTVDNLVETGSVYCAIPCDTSQSTYCDRTDDGSAAFYIIPGRIEDISAGLVVCNLAKLKKLDRAIIVDIIVMFDELASVDVTSLPATSVQFTMKKPAPTLVSALWNWQGCSNITVEFSTYIKAPEGPCNEIFIVTGSQIPSDVQCVGIGKTIVMMFGATSLLSVGTELVLQEGVVYDASSQQLDIRTYSTGSINIAKPQMIEPELSIEGPIEIGVQRDFISVRTQKSGCFQFDLSWTVTPVTDSPTSELTTKIDALNARLASMDERARRRFSLTAAEFVSGEVVTLRLDWAATIDSTISGIAEHNLTRNDAKVITAKIQHNSGRDVDRNKRHELSAYVNMDPTQADQEANVYYEWKLSPAVTDVKEINNRLIIVENTLRADQGYTVYLKVTYQVGETSFIASDRINFKTTSKPLVPKINGKLDPQMTASIVDDITLRSQGEDPDGSDDTEFYTWTLESNENAVNPDDDETAFKPVREIVGGVTQPYHRFTDSIVLLAADRRTDSSNLRYLATLEWRKGGRTSNTSIIINCKRITYYPEIIRRRKTGDTESQEIITVNHKTKKKLIYRKCYAMTEHYFASAEGYPEIDMSAITMNKHQKRIQMKYKPSREKKRTCLLWLDWTKDEAQEYINGMTYAVTLYAVSGSDIATETFIINTYVPPTPGIVEVRAVDDSISLYEALKTEFEINLWDWWDEQDGIDLQCLYYKRESSSRKWEKIFPRYLPMATRTFTLGEGTYEFKATCRNSQKLSSTMVSESEIEVGPVDLEEEEQSNTIVETAALTLQTKPQCGVSVIMQLVSFTTVYSHKASSGYITSVETFVYAQVNVVIAATIVSADEPSEPDDAFEAAAETTSMLKAVNKPSAISAASTASIFSSLLAATRAKTGKSSGSSRRRKKREVIEYCATGDGSYTVDNGVVTLETIEAVTANRSVLSVDNVAEDILELMEGIMLGLCQSYSEDGTVPVDAVATELGVRLLKPAINSSLAMDILHDNYTNPASLYYGSNFETLYSSTQDCDNETVFCPSDVCVATAQFNIDFVTELATIQTVAPTRYSGIIMIKFYDPDTGCEKQADVSSDPVLITITTNATDLTDFDLLCMMWVSEDWDETPCTTGVPTLNGNVYDVICSCTQFGILGVFETAKANDTYATLTVPTTTAATTTAKPSISLQAVTTYTTVRFSVIATFSTQIGRFTESVLSAHLKQDLADQTGITVELIVNFVITEGSIVITFDLYPSSSSGSDTLGQMLWTIENMVESGTLTLTNPDGDVLPVNVTSFSYTEQSPSTSDGDDGKPANIGGIVGGVIGALIGISVGVGAGIFYYKKHHSKSMNTHRRPSPPLSPAPSYTQSSAPPVFSKLKKGAAPDYNSYNTHFSTSPPPYTLQTPTKDKLYPKTEKWTENELKPHAPVSVIDVEGVTKVGDAKKLEDMLDTPQRSKTTITLGSKSSMELQVRQPSPEERAPTPVDH